MGAIELAGRKILLVEDEVLVAAIVEGTLMELGCITVGPVGDLRAALKVATAGKVDAAILDVSIRGGTVFPVAKALRARGIPIVLASGYGDWAFPDELLDAPRLLKPFYREDLETALKKACGGG